MFVVTVDDTWHTRGSAGWSSTILDAYRGRNVYAVPQTVHDDVVGVRVVGVDSMSMCPGARLAALDAGPAVVTDPA